MRTACRINPSFAHSLPFILVVCCLQAATGAFNSRLVDSSRASSYHDTTAPWDPDTWDYDRYGDSFQDQYDSASDKLSSFFSTAADDARYASARLQDQAHETGDRAADWLDQGKHQARDWLGRIKHSAEDIADRTTSKYYQTQDKAKATYHDTLGHFYQTKANVRGMVTDGGGFLDNLKRRVRDSRYGTQSPIAEEIERLKMRRWVHDVARTLETTPYTRPEFNYNARSWFQRAASDIEDKAEKTYDKSKEAFFQFRHKLEDAFDNSKEVVEHVKHQAKRRLFD